MILPAFAAAQDTSLKLLDSMESGRMWDAVGRLDIDGRGFCTASLIAPDLVLTAAHCLFDKQTKQRISPHTIEFMAGLRNGRASAYRYVRRAVVHPGYVYGGAVSSDRVRNDVALLELQRPIQNTAIMPFDTALNMSSGKEVGIVSYAHDRAEAPSLQELCNIMARQSGVLVMSCNVDFGSSGAPVFSFAGGKPHIVSVVSAKAEVDGSKVALGTALDEPLSILMAELDNGGGFALAPAPRFQQASVMGARSVGGAKFIKP